LKSSGKTLEWKDNKLLAASLQMLQQQTLLQRSNWKSNQRKHSIQNKLPLLLFLS